MLVSYVVRRVEVSIQTVPTGAAFEERLRATIRTMLIPAVAAHLGRVTWIYPLYTDTTFLRLVCREVIQLRKGPTVQSAFRIMRLALANVRAGSNVGQVFKDKRCTRRSVLDYPLTQYVVAVPVETRLPLAQLLQVAFGRLRSVGLELAADAEGTAVNFLPMRGAQKLTL